LVLRDFESNQHIAPFQSEGNDTFGDSVPAGRSCPGAALASGSAGLYRIAIQVRNALAEGDWPIQASIG
jgi:hypothetical protein